MEDEKKKQPAPPLLSGSSRRALRALGHHLEPSVMLGKDGLTANVEAAIDANLLAHELIKIKIHQNCPYERDEAAVLLSEVAGAAIAQLLGKTILLYRPNPDKAKEERISLQGGGAKSAGAKGRGAKGRGTKSSGVKDRGVKDRGAKNRGVKDRGAKGSPKA